MQVGDVSRSDNFDIFKSLRDGKIKALWAFGNNVYKQVPDLNTHKKLISDTFFIVQNRIKTEMNEDADVVFPAATWGDPHCQAQDLLVADQHGCHVFHLFTNGDDGRNAGLIIGKMKNDISSSLIDSLTATIASTFRPDSADKPAFELSVNFRSYDSCRSGHIGQASFGDDG